MSKLAALKIHEFANITFFFKNVSKVKNCICMQDKQVSRVFANHFSNCTMKIGRRNYNTSVTFCTLCIRPRHQKQPLWKWTSKTMKILQAENFKYFYVLFTYIGKVNIQAAMNIFGLTGSGNGGDEIFVVLLTITWLEFSHSTTACS